MKRVILPLLFGMLGCAILLKLGFWQLDRLAWKQALLADIDARIDRRNIDVICVRFPRGCGRGGWCVLCEPGSG